MDAEPVASRTPFLEVTVEESPEAFVSRWRRWAADAEIFARPEGVPLIECAVGGAVIQVFERTGPYLARPGRGRLIVNPTARELSVLGAAEEVHLESLGLSRVAVTGRVLEVHGGTVIVDAGAPLVVNVTPGAANGLAPGSVVSFESESPVHGFIVPQERSAHARREAVDDSI